MRNMAGDGLITCAKKIYRSFLLFMLVVFTVVTTNWIHIKHLSLISVFDWSYFNGLSLFTRSAVLYYKTMPIYNPWMCGGLDVLSNPQNRIFSPMFILDLLFSPNLANIISLMVYGIAGFYGCLYLLRHLKISFSISVICSLIFINSQWFGLHFAQGHLPFGFFLLMPWVLLCIMNFHLLKYYYAFISIMILFLLGGGIYSFNFSCVMLLCGLLFGYFDIVGTIIAIREKGLVLHYIILLIVFFFLVAIKIVPSVLFARESQIDTSIIPLSALVDIFLKPNAQPIQNLPYSVYWYHEFGCYLGIVSVIIVAFQLRSVEFVIFNKRFILAIFFFFWIGSGWGTPFNPWILFQKIPLLNIAHVQSRYLFIMYLFYICVLANALEYIKVKDSAWKCLLTFLIIESFFVRIYPVYMTYEHCLRENHSRVTQKLITHESFAYTAPYGVTPWQYLDKDAFGCKAGYEPSAVPTNVKYKAEVGYKGEAYFTNGSGVAKLVRVTPGKYEVEYTIASDGKPTEIEINANYLAGWKVIRGNAKVFKSESNLIRIQINKNNQLDLEKYIEKGVIEIKYTPFYLKPLLILYIIGGCVWLYYFLWLSHLHKLLTPKSPLRM